MRGLREPVEPAAAAGRLRAAPLRRPRGGSGRRAPSPRSSREGGEAAAEPRALLSRKDRGGRGRNPTIPGPAVRRDRGTRRPLLLLAESVPRSPRRRVSSSSSLALSGASVGGCPAAASCSASSPSARLPHVASRPARGGGGGILPPSNSETLFL